MSEYSGGSVDSLFAALESWDAIEDLIRDGEPEGQYLECKTPQSPSAVSWSFLNEVGLEISGFSNAGGGIVILGVRTDKKHGMDVLTQIEPIGAVREVDRKLKLKIPFLTTPSVDVETRILKEKEGDTKGIVVMAIPGAKGDPVQTKEGLFYIRTGDETPPMPYEAIKRMFLGGASPDVVGSIASGLIKHIEGRTWKLAVVVGNRATAPGKSVSVSVDLLDLESCQRISGHSGFQDVSDYNIGHKMFVAHSERPVHRELDIVVGYINVSLAARRRKVPLRIDVFAERMRAKRTEWNVYLSGTGEPRVVKRGEWYLY